MSVGVSARRAVTDSDACEKIWRVGGAQRPTSATGVFQSLYVAIQRVFNLKATVGISAALPLQARLPVAKK